MSWIDGEREPITVSKLIVYAICAVVFGFFFLFNIVWIIATIQAFLSLVGL